MRLKEKTLDVYAWLLRQFFMLPGPFLNLFARTSLVVMKPILKNRNYRRRMEEALTRLATKDHPYIELSHNIASSSWNCWRAFAVSFLLHRLALGVSKTMSDVGRERRLERKGMWWPSVLVLSITTECNLDCYKCYAAGDRFEPCELEYSVIDRIVTEGESNGTYMYNIIGGEPMLRANELWELFRTHPNSCFVIFTNGTLVDAETARMVTEVGNVVISVSIDGFEITNDARRGEGVFRQAIEALDHLASVRAPSAVSVTVTHQNYKEVISRAYIELLLSHGIMEVTLNQFVPGDRKPDPEMELDEYERAGVLFFAELLRDDYPVWVRVGRVAIDEVPVCDAARRHLHIAPNGDVEPCLFCPLSVDNIHDVSLGEAMNSGFFDKVRALNGTPETTCPADFTKPCMMFRDPEVGMQLEALRAS